MCVSFHTTNLFAYGIMAHERHAIVLISQTTQCGDGDGTRGGGNLFNAAPLLALRRP